MAERRLFTKKITESDAFMEMPSSAQCLYFHLCMNADDDGFVSSPKKIMRELRSSEDDAIILINKHFVIAFESGVVVIKHWLMHNTIRKDRYVETDYLEEKSTLYIKPNGVYTLDSSQGKPLLATKWQPNGNQMATAWQPNDNQWLPQDKLSKDKLSKDNIYKENTIVKENSTATAVESEKKRQYFTPPTIEEVKEYCKERRNGIDAEEFCDFYQSKGWFVGSNKMKDWKSAVRTWEKKRKADKTFAERDYTESEIDSVFTDLNNYDDIEI